MRPVYQSLFSLTTNHSYFSDKICKGIIFNPTEETKRFMVHFGLISKFTNNSFTIFADTTIDLNQKINWENINKGTFLQFNITFTDSNFFLYTDLKANQYGYATYSANSNLNIKRDEITELTALPNATNNCVQISLSSLLEAAEKKCESKFEINFFARSTQWRYFLINKSNIDINDLAIRNKAIAFTGPVEVILEYGEKALLFSSGDSLIPLTEKPNLQFSLVSKKSTIIKSLPTVNLPTGSFVRGVPKPDHLTSDIVITI